MAIAVSLGTVIGALAGYWGADQWGWMRTTDLFLSLPTLPLLSYGVYLFRDPMMKTFGPELGMFLIVIIMIGLLAWMTTPRIVRYPAA